MEILATRKKNIKKNKKEVREMPKQFGKLMSDELNELMRFVGRAIKNLNKTLTYLIEAGMDVDEIVGILDDEGLRRDAELMEKMAVELERVLRKLQRLEDKL
jgi:predicted transcriptional regulator